MVSMRGAPQWQHSDGHFTHRPWSFDEQIQPRLAGAAAVSIESSCHARTTANDLPGRT